MTSPAATLQIAASRSRPPGGRRPGDAEVRRRMALVERMLADGVSRSVIAAEVRLPQRTADQYIARVRQAWQSNAEQDHGSARARAIERLTTLRQRLLEERAWSPLVRVEQLLCELEGVRGGPADAPPPEDANDGIEAPALSAVSLRQRAPILVRACARLALASGDEELQERVRQALSAAIADFENASS